MLQCPDKFANHFTPLFTLDIFLCQAVVGSDVIPGRIKMSAIPEEGEVARVSLYSRLMTRTTSLPGIVARKGSAPKSFL